MIVLGLDPGVTTGFATWNAQTRQFLEVRSLLIHEAMDEIVQRYAAGELALVVFEDARLRKFFGSRADLNTSLHGAGVREGVGSVKRDCKIWEDFLRSLGVPFDMRHPRGTKKKAELFAQLTGWTDRTNEHARDAAMLIVGMNSPMVAGLVRDFHSRRKS